jgi:amino acid transporter/mannitol/fructose-specific phosphotransferase system IIA component (Ntr-type)
MAKKTSFIGLKKELSLFGVFAIATGTTLSSGFFILPGLAAERAGAAVVLCYAIAALLLVPAMFSIIELATAMPRAGGAYYFLDRSLGPLAGTVGGFGTWSALVLKSAFALYGMGAYVQLLFHEAPIIPVAVGLAVLFGVVNILGAREASRFQMFLVLGLLAILTWFIGYGMGEVEPASFEGFFDAGAESIVGTAGLVFISYVGLTKVASVSEEVKDPERTLPLGIVLALGTAVVVYVLGVAVMVGVLGPGGLAETLTPVAAAADRLADNVGVIAVSVAAILAFSSVANAGILSASRYPLAMSRDHLVPRVFRTLTRGRRTPWISIVFTVGAIVFCLIVLRDPTNIAKLASAFQLLMFGLICLAVIVMRESGIESYDPGFRSPLYPWMQIVGLCAPLAVIGEMGGMAVLFSAALVAIALAWYFLYAHEKIERQGAIYHVFERLGRRRYAALDSELRGILKEKGLRQQDPFEEVVARAGVIRADAVWDFEAIVERAAGRLAEVVGTTPDTLARGFLEGTRTGATPVTHGVALPHLRVADIDAPHMVLVQCHDGIEIPTGEDPDSPRERTYAIFFLVSPVRDPGQHLRLLAELAGRVDQEGFIHAWRSAGDEHTVREILLRDDRFVSLHVARGTPTDRLIGKAIRDVGIPEGCLVAVIRRKGDTLVPGGSTIIRAGDRLTVIGSEVGIGQLREQYRGSQHPSK